MDVLVLALDLLLLEGLGASCSAPEFIVSVLDLPADPHSAHEEYSNDSDVLVLLNSCHLDEVFFVILEGLFEVVEGVFPPKIFGCERFFSVEKVQGLFSLFIA